MDLGLEGRVALVTGASRGLGRACARGLAEEGAALVVNARGAERLERTARELGRETGVEVLPVAADVTDPDAPDRLVEAAVERFGRLDVLVANAGGPPAGGFDDIDEVATYRDALELSLLGTIRLIRAAVPAMRARGWGRIVALTSVSVKEPIDGLLLSNTARPGVVGFVKTLSRELAPEGVNLNVVAPGYMATERVEELARETAERRGVEPSEVRAGWTADIPAGRIGEPRELGDAVAFLCSERASFVTGQTLAVDGGYVRGLL